MMEAREVSMHSERAKEDCRGIAWAKEDCRGVAWAMPGRQGARKDKTHQACEVLEPTDHSLWTCGGKLLLSSQFWPIRSMPRSAKLCLSHPFSRIQRIDQWDDDPDPILTSTRSAKIGKTAINLTNNTSQTTLWHLA